LDCLRRSAVNLGELDIVGQRDLVNIIGDGGEHSALGPQAGKGDVVAARCKLAPEQNQRPVMTVAGKEALVADQDPLCLAHNGAPVGKWKLSRGAIEAISRTSSGARWPTDNCVSGASTTAAIEASASRYVE